jgi:hypothetical protein
VTRAQHRGAPGTRTRRALSAVCSRPGRARGRTSQTRTPAGRRAAGRRSSRPSVQHAFCRAAVREAALRSCAPARLGTRTWPRAAAASPVSTRRHGEARASTKGAARWMQRRRRAQTHLQRHRLAWPQAAHLRVPALHDAADLRTRCAACAGQRRQEEDAKQRNTCLLRQSPSQQPPWVRQYRLAAAAGVPLPATC